jgi:hypothetical protein
MYRIKAALHRQTNECFDVALMMNAHTVNYYVFHFSNRHEESASKQRPKLLKVSKKKNERQ